MTTFRRGALPAVLVGGWAVNAGMVAQVLADWPGPVTVVTLDDELILGCTGVNDVADALVDRYPGEAVWLGWSLGAQIVMAAADRHPDQVRGVVTLAGFPRFVAAENWGFGMPAPVFRSFASGMESNPRRSWQRFMVLQIKGDDREREARCHLASWLDDGCPLSDQALRKGLGWLENNDQRSLWRSSGIPALHLFGEKDAVVDARMATMVLPPGASAVVVPGMAHWPCLDSVKRVRKALGDFFDRVSESELHGFGGILSGGSR